MIEVARTSGEDSYYKHFSSGRNEYTNLQFLFIDEALEEVLKDFSVKPNEIAIIRVEPNKVVDWHVDNPKFRRNTVIIFPLTPEGKDYAACETDNGPIPFSDCYAFNTNVRHRVVNNQYERLSLQLFFDEDIETLWNILNER